MVKLPTREDLGPLPPARTGRMMSRIEPQVSEAGVIAARGNQVAAQGLMDLGRGLGQAANTIEAELDRRQDEDDAIAGIKAKAELERRRIEFRRQAEDYTGNPDDLRGIHDKNWKDVEETLLPSFRNPRQQAAWQAELETSRARDSEDVEDTIRRKRKDLAFGETTAALETQFRNYFEASPEEKPAYLSYMSDAINAAPVDEATKIRWREKYLERAGDTEIELRKSQVQTPEDLDAFEQFLEGQEAAPQQSSITKDLTNRLMTDLGLTREQAAGVVGNLAHETGGFKYFEEIDPVVPGSEGGIGWAQWTGPRRKEFLEWTEAQGLDPKSAEANYGFLLHELGGTHSEALDAVKSAATPEEAMLAFEQHFEKSGVKNYKSRMDYTNRVLREQTGIGMADPVTVSEAKIWINEQRTKVGSPIEASLRFNQDPAARPYNPLDPDEKKRAETIAESNGWSQAIMQGDWETFDNEITPWVAKWNAIPDGIKGAIKAGLSSNDPKKVAGAIQAMDGLQRANPGAFLNTMDNDTVELLERYRIDRNFTESDEEIGQKIIDERQDASKKLANEELRKEGEKYAAKHAPYVMGLFQDGPFSLSDRPVVERLVGLATGSLPEAPEGSDHAALQQDYIRLFGLAFEKTNDYEKARGMARQALLKRWSESNVSGVRRVMRNAPERFNPQGLDAKWQNIQARARLGPLIGDNPFILESDDRTDLEIAQGKTPTWIVMVPGTTTAGFGE